MKEPPINYTKKCSGGTDQYRKNRKKQYRKKRRNKRRVIFHRW